MFIRPTACASAPFVNHGRLRRTYSAMFFAGGDETAGYLHPRIGLMYFYIKKSRNKMVNNNPRMMINPPMVPNRISDPLL